MILWCRRKVGRAGGFGDSGLNHFKTEYTLKSNTPSESRQVVLNCGMLPRYADPHPENTLSVCVKADVTQNREAPLFWDAVCEWNTRTDDDKDPEDEQEQPDERRERWSARFVKIPSSRFHDTKGILLADAAGTPFDPPPNVPIICDQITVQRYEASCDRAKQRGFMYKSNKDVWQGAEAGTALIDDISVDDEYLQGAWWSLTTYVILIQPRLTLAGAIGGSYKIGGWDPEYVLNAGPLVLDDNGKPRPPRGAYYDGRPVLLFKENDGSNKKGQELPRDANGVYTKNATYLEFCTKPQVKFSELELRPPYNWGGSR